MKINERLRSSSSIYVLVALLFSLSVPSLAGAPNRLTAAQQAKVNASLFRALAPCRGECPSRTSLTQVITALNCGAQVNICDYNKFTPLLLAASGGRLDCVTLFVARGANIEATDSEKWTPLMAAVYHDHLGCAQYLLSKGAKMPSDGKPGIDAMLFQAASGGGVHCVSYFISLGANVNAQGEDGSTPLFDAAEFPPTCARMLVAAGANVNMAARDGRTALMSAANIGNAPTVKYLIDQGADVNRQDNAGNTALSAAMGWHNDGIIKLLKAAGEKQ